MNEWIDGPIDGLTDALIRLMEVFCRYMNRWIHEWMDE